MPGCNHVFNRTALRKWTRLHDEEDVCPQCFDEEEEEYLNGSDSTGSLEDFIVDDDDMEYEDDSSKTKRSPSDPDGENINELIAEANNFIQHGVYRPGNDDNHDVTATVTTAQLSADIIADKVPSLFEESGTIKIPHDVDFHNEFSEERRKIKPCPMVRT